MPHTYDAHVQFPPCVICGKSHFGQCSGLLTELTITDQTHITIGSYSRDIPPFMPISEVPDNATSPEYKYEEDTLLREIKEYIDATYTQHYSGKYQATDMIIDAGHGDGFCVGNILKYGKRYGKKSGHNRKDLMKIIHYAIIALHVHNLEHKDENL